MKCIILRQGAPIKVGVRTAKEKKMIETKEKEEVKDFKSAISEAFGKPVELLTLIWHGKRLQQVISDTTTTPLIRTT